MELRSSRSARQGSSFPSLSRKASCSSPTDKNSAMAKALRIPVVLDSIFANIDTTELKTARLVCRDWSDVGAGVLGKRAFLDINRAFRYNGSRSYQATPVHDKLTRRLIIRDDYDLLEKRTNDVITMNKIFTHLASRVSKSTRELEFCVTLKKFETAFLNGLRTLDSTQIQQISIFIHSRNANVDTCRIQALPKLPNQQNLTSLKFQIPLHLYHGIHAFQPLLQVLIDSAPNLTSLDVVAAFFPSLEVCKNLKVLKFFYANCKHEACPEFELAKVTSMLTAVKDSLMELELCYDVFRAYGIQSGIEIQAPNLDVPVMSSLISLTINRGDVYLIQDFFDEEHLPKLRNLTFKNENYMRMDLSAHLNMWKRHRGVQSFALKTNGSYHVIRKHGETIVQLFPAVKKLHLMWTGYGHIVNEVTPPFRPWDLEEVKLVVRYVCFASRIVGILRNMAILSGVKMVHFEYAYINEDDFSAHTQDVVLCSGGYKCVEISGSVVPEVVDEMRPIFEASGAPVDFKGGVWRN